MQGGACNIRSTLKLKRPPPSNKKRMDLSSARSLMMTSKHNKGVEVMLTLFREEAKTFGRSSVFAIDGSAVPVSPETRCCMRRGGGRCRGAVPELAVTQMCAYHQVHKIGDRNLDGMRCFSTANPGLFNLVFHGVPQGRN